MANRLAQESSPYLLQHAHNPVDWYPWGEEALQRAKEEDKPILVSIGYAACHWCHVMERESFEDSSIAAFMNEYFINIKIDREERPDLDHIYMDAVQSMTGSGGWPLNVFLTPDLKPFYGGTYFPPRPVHQRASWQQVLQAVATAFDEKRDAIYQQAQQLTQHLQQANSFGAQNNTEYAQLFQASGIIDATINILKIADKEWGGFSAAPKFPQSFVIRYLLRVSQQKVIWQQAEDNSIPEEALQLALLSLDKMMEGGIYDQIGGGFARYSTDTQWLAPHFEKMLYDNALLLQVYAEAYQLTGQKKYRKLLEETFAFLQREMLHEQGGFYAALDADSEGEEGKYYVWSKTEIDELLGEDAKWFCEWYDVTDAGNWEGKNILHVPHLLESFINERGWTEPEWEKKLAHVKTVLLAHRNTRVRPLLDDKIILGWNALLNTSLSKMYAATTDPQYLQAAEMNMNFLLTYMKLPNGELWHTYKNGQAKIPAFLDDYAWMIQALIQLAEVSGRHSYLLQARQLTEKANELFSEPDSGLYFYTATGQPDIIVRKKEVYDGATPSGNAVMADNLHRLGILFDVAEWQERSDKMLLALGQAMVRYPGSFGCWCNLFLEKFAGTAEIAVVGEEAERRKEELLKYFLPHRVLMTTKKPEDSFPLLAGKYVFGQTYIYVCRNFACQQPVTTTDAVISQIYR